METSDEELRKSKRQKKKCAEIGRILIKEEVKARVKQVTNILKKKEDSRTAEDEEILKQSPEIVLSVDKRAKSRDVAKQRLLEIEDGPELLEEKCCQLAAALRDSTNVVVYTGAGISTAASIPDYRGPNGVWTLLQKGKEIKAQDLSDAEPTLTHMSIAKLHHENLVKHVVSQNCDGLHLRSGFSRRALSEVHGNMFIELCRDCKPVREYIRLFDVTERTGVRRHATGRDCHVCGSPLRDTIVHFGEKGGLQSPYNWQEAADAVDECDMILCLGSSLKILRKYPCLWSMDLRPKDRPKLFIVNLQWTPKDDMATLKINGKCDEVMGSVMRKLGLSVPEYRRAADPLFKLSTRLMDSETNTTSKKILLVPEKLEPNQFCGSVKKGIKRTKNTKKDLPTSKVHKAIKSVLDKDVKCESDTSVDLTDSSSSNSSNGTVIVCDQTSERLKPATTSGDFSLIPHPADGKGIKQEHPVLSSRLGFLVRNNSDTGTLSKQQSIPQEKRNCESCQTFKHCSCPRFDDAHISDMSDFQKTNSFKVHVDGPKTEQTDEDEQSIGSSLGNLQSNSLDFSSQGEITPTSPTTFPGWFGKGCNPRKRKKRL